MKGFIFLSYFLLRLQLQQSGAWMATIMFNITSLFILSLLLPNLFEQQIVWAFYILLQNFMVAFYLKDIFHDDMLTSRLYALQHQKLSFGTYLFTLWFVHSFVLFSLQLITWPFINIFFEKTLVFGWMKYIFWQMLSACLLSSLYSMGAAFSLKSRLGGVLNLLIVLPLSIPWCLISMQFFLTAQLDLLGVLAGFFLIALPVSLQAQNWILRSVII